MDKWNSIQIMGEGNIQETEAEPKRGFLSYMQKSCSNDRQRKETR